MSSRSSNSIPKFSGLSIAIVLALFVYREWQSANAAKRTSTTTHSRSHRSKANADNVTPPVSGGVASGQDSNDGNLLLGNASSAGTDPNNYLLERKQYSLSFNHARGGPNWVAWHTDEADLGDTDRGKFKPDPQLPADWRITPADYKNSGYDRGHVCPSGDRTDSRADNDATFYMSNMVPQTGELNRHIWAQCEESMRGLVKQGNELYTIAGGVGDNGTIAGGKVTIPKVCWKVVVVLPEGQNDLSRINADTRIIVIGIPNVTDKRLETGDWRAYLTNLDKIQNATKLNLLSALPAKVRSALGSKVDSGQ